MTRFGEFLARRHINKSSLSKRTGLTTQRLNDLSLKSNARPMAFEVYLVAKAIEADLNEIHLFLFGDLELIDTAKEKSTDSK
ncbi:putative transcriptional regulator [Pedobacter sp. ok626]|uniref:hypothetical protein n=1 Tax=Pedobacter sp. ok626 TaxID=1761882 RepID=UPI00087ECB3D|nr:hypothetical protein [Pedobacter sp. ok626]SDK58909.1 putative transcriptional regulator [Pedobacter sp. ok626]